MVIGTAAAILGGAALLGTVVSAKSSSSATNNATAASERSTAANNAVALQTYGENKATLAPFVAQGGAATGYINQLLGIQAPQSTSGFAYGSAPQPQQGQRYFEDLGYSGNGSGRFGGMGGISQPGFASQTMPPQAANGGAPPPGAANNAFDAYRNSTGLQFRIDQGSKAVTNNHAVNGLLHSGSVVKALQRLGQNEATPVFNDYLAQLQGQQGVGLSAASAQAGVANTYSSQVQGNNAVNATNAGNAAIAKANGTSSAISGLLSAGAYAYGARG